MEMKIAAATVSGLARGAAASAALALIAGFSAAQGAGGEGLTRAAWWAAGALGGLWLLGVWRGWGWTAPLGLGATVALAALGVWMGASGWGALVAVGAALAAWDLQRFLGRLRRAGRVDAEEALVEAHLKRLALVLSVGLGLGGLALSWPVRIGFWWTLLLSLVAVVGLHRALRLAHRMSPPCDLERREL